MTREEALEIYKDRSAKFRSTQTIQWRLNLSIWTLYILAIFNNPKLNTYVSYAVPLALLVLHYLYCLTIQRSLEYDKLKTDDIIESLNEDNQVIEIDMGKRPHPYRGWKWILLQLSVSFLLLITFYASNFK